MKAIGTNDMLSKIKGNVKALRDLWNERPHELGKSPEHPFGGRSTKNGKNYILSVIGASTLSAALIFSAAAAAIVEVKEMTQDGFGVEEVSDIKQDGCEKGRVNLESLKERIESREVSDQSAKPTSKGRGLGN